jgi:hypothetical protein
MYDDPAHIKKHPVKPKFNDAAYAAIVAIARLNNLQPTTFVHDLVMSYLKDREQKGSDEARVA